MTLDEMLQKMTDIGTAEDDASRRAIITEVSDEIKTVFGTVDTLTESKNKLDADNKKLQEYNMQLFLKVGGQKKQEVTPEGDEPDKNLTYENLFNEKGELK